MPAYLAPFLVLHGESFLSSHAPTSVYIPLQPPCCGLPSRYVMVFSCAHFFSRPSALGPDQTKVGVAEDLEPFVIKTFFFRFRSGGVFAEDSSVPLGIFKLFGSY